MSIMADEYLDIYNCKGLHLGKESRKLIHQKGMWHKTFHCWIIFKNDVGEDCVLMQKRGANKSSAPNKLDSSVAGHYEAGEAIMGGIREFKEETGLDIDSKDLIPLGIRVSVSDYRESDINKELQEVFFIKKTVPLESLTLPVDEVAGMVELPVDRCIELFDHQIDHFFARGVFNDDASSLGTPLLKNTKIVLEDFIFFIDNFHFKIMLLAKRALAGEKYLFI
jgi:isopentenyldiphosphate isomerase